MVRYGAELPVSVIEAQIATAIDVVVQTTRYPDGSRGICEIAGFSWSEEKLRCLVDQYYVRDLLQENANGVAILPGWTTCLIWELRRVRSRTVERK